MMSQLTWEYKIALFAAVLALILSALLRVEWWYATEYRDQLLKTIFSKQQTNFEMQAIPAYGFVKQPVEAYHDFIARPIVFESRKPIAKFVEPTAPPVPEVPKPPPGEFGLVLTGIIKMPHGGVKALFQDPNGKTVEEKNRRLTVGESFNGWRLIDIQSDSIKIQAESEVKSVMLRKEKPKTPTFTAGAPMNPFAAPNMNAPPVPPPPNILPPNVPIPTPVPNVNPFNINH